MTKRVKTEFVTIDFEFAHGRAPKGQPDYALGALVTARELLALRAGALLTVTLRSGHEVEAKLLGDPWIESVGEPGLGRVRLSVIDVEHARHIDKHFDRFDRVNRATRSPFCGPAKAKHVVTGEQVKAVQS